MPARLSKRRSGQEHRMPTPAFASFLSRCLLVLSVAAGACLHKPDQYDPTQDPVFFPQGGAAGGVVAGGGRGGSSGGDGPSQVNDAEPSNQVCGTTCEAEMSDGCCPVGCTGASDIDCKAQCGNSVLERGEECDPPSSCPASCPNRGCTKFNLEGSAAECTALCVEAGKETACKPDDGCCPAGCTTADDSDCAIMCGNGTKEGNETCDPLASCPTTCPADACQLKKLVNADSCTAECVNDRLQTACTPGDGCCPAGCHTGNDSDCSAACDNGIKESGETCDPLASCPSTCPANECQLRKLVNADSCKAQCVNDRLQTACQSGDDCCPPGCNTANDNDCGVRCGDGVKDTSETCDPLSSCPTQCPAMGCQLRELKNAGTCKAACESSRLQTACASNDDCCPGACHNNNDSDCAPKCGNGVVERDEKCEPVAECTRRQTACRSDRDTIREGRGNPAQCTFECSESQRQCGAPDGQCPSGCQNDPDCKRANGAACENAGQCLSNRCTDGRCCAETCGTCEKCTAAGGQCELPSGTKICGSSCVPTSTCCTNGQAGRCPDCASCVGGTCMQTQRSCGNGRCVALGACCANCPGPCQRCNAAGTGCENVDGAACGNPGATCSGRTNDKPDTCRGGTCQSNSQTCATCQECTGGSCQAKRCGGGERCEDDRCVPTCMPGCQGDREVTCPGSRDCPNGCNRGTGRCNPECRPDDTVCGPSDDEVRQCLSSGTFGPARRCVGDNGVGVRCNFDPNVNQCYVCEYDQCNNDGRTLRICTFDRPTNRFNGTRNCAQTGVGRCEQQQNNGLGLCCCCPGEPGCDALTAAGTHSFCEFGC
jgi:hypothetical protein